MVSCQASLSWGNIRLRRMETGSAKSRTTVIKEDFNCHYVRMILGMAGMIPRRVQVGRGVGQDNADRNLGLA